MESEKNSSHLLRLYLRSETVLDDAQTPAEVALRTYNIVK